ncbi:MAG TPA: MauE/DoxX family redox-associated membrane protein [Bacteroidia bacterium]|nr:MauE/DoxX family redox-associated membrane protein [Bacteroidia bacterium]
MTHTYKITGMTCSGCEATVTNNLLKLPDVKSVEVSKETGAAIITMEKHIPIKILQEALGGENGKYKIAAADHEEQEEEVKDWLSTYKPLLILFAYILAISLLSSGFVTGIFNMILWMRYFMAGFFLAFSFFKLINLVEFADSYSMYDIVAKRIKAWGFIYPFVEVALGIAYLIDFNPFITNITTILVMGISSIGVIESVLNKKKIKCACLGAVFNLPMSTLTIIEDLLMVVMAIGMLVYYSR